MAATVQEAGMDSWEFLNTRDSLERTVRQAVANAILERRRSDDQSRANQIANAVGKMLTGKD
jgi:hypothetical protein